MRVWTCKYNLHLTPTWSFTLYSYKMLQWFDGIGYLLQDGCYLIQQYCSRQQQLQYYLVWQPLLQAICNEGFSLQNVRLQEVRTVTSIYHITWQNSLVNHSLESLDQSREKDEMIVLYKMVLNTRKYTKRLLIQFLGNTATQILITDKLNHI